MWSSSVAIWRAGAWSSRVCSASTGSLVDKTPGRPARTPRPRPLSNLGFLGPPPVLAFFGERGAGTLAMAIMAEVMVLLSVGAMIMGVARGGDAGTGSLPVRGVQRGVLRGAL